MEGVLAPEGDFAGASVVMVDCEEEREKVLASGARCVSFNSVVCQHDGVESEQCQPNIDVGTFEQHWRDVLLVSFHDMAVVADEDVAWCLGRMWAEEG